MRETAKNYKDRIENKDFERYLHGSGIDIGGGEDCLVLPPDISGNVYLWDFEDGDAQYLHKLEDETFDFVYSSHCLEHMRDVNIAFANWLRVCRVNGYLYICVPHEVWYEKGIWPSVNNLDHKHSFTVDKKTTLPKNIVIKDFLQQYMEYIEIVDIRENLKNYDFNCDKEIDQTADFEKMVCAQIDIIIKKKRHMKKSYLQECNRHYLMDQIFFLFPMRVFLALPLSLQNGIKGFVRRLNKNNG